MRGATPFSIDRRASACERKREFCSISLDLLSLFITLFLVFISYLFLCATPDTAAAASSSSTLRCFSFPNSFRFSFYCCSPLHPPPSSPSSRVRVFKSSHWLSCSFPAVLDRRLFLPELFSFSFSAGNLILLFLVIVPSLPLNVN